MGQYWSGASDEDRRWERRLFPLLVVTFFFAAGAALASAHPPPAPPPAASPASASAATPTAATSEPVPTTTNASKGRTTTASAVTLLNLIPMQVADVVLAEGESTGVVLLVDNKAELVLPMFVVAAEGDLVRRSLRGEKPSGAHANLRQVVDSLGGEIERVEVTETRGEATQSQVVVRRGTEEVMVQAIPAEAIALALASGSQLFVGTSFATAQGIRRADIKRRPTGMPSSLKAPERM